MWRRPPAQSSLLLVEEGERPFDELRCGVEEDGAVIGVGDDPEGGAGNGAIHLDRQLKGIGGRPSE